MKFSPPPPPTEIGTHFVSRCIVSSSWQAKKKTKHGYYCIQTRYKYTKQPLYLSWKYCTLMIHTPVHPYTKNSELTFTAPLVIFFNFLAMPWSQQSFCFSYLVFTKWKNTAELQNYIWQLSLKQISTSTTIASQDKTTEHKVSIHQLVCALQLTSNGLCSALGLTQQLSCLAHII